MEHECDFRLPVTAASAYLTATLAAVSGVGALIVLVMLGRLVRAAHGLARQQVTTPVFVLVPLLAAGLLVSATVMAVLARTEFRLLRNPPLFTSDGVRLRVFARRGYDVFVPWERLTGLRIANRGPRAFLVLDVAGAEEFFGDDPGKSERVRRTAERFDGATFAYALRGALIRAEDLGAVVHRLSGGAVALDL